MPDEPLSQLPIAIFLDRLASAAPTPGGGSAAALTGALAASLGQMVAALTVRQPKFAAAHDEALALARRLARARELLTRLIDEDAAAYETLRSALRCDRTDPTRGQSVAQAAELAGQVPLETAAVCTRLLSDAQRLAEIGNPHLRSDAQAALHLARAALHAAAANVRVNLPLMPPDAAREMETQLAELERGTA